MIEYPTLTFESAADLASQRHRFHQVAIQKFKSEPEFRRVWPSVDAMRGFDHLVKLKVDGFEAKRGRNLFGAFQLFSGILFGPNPNVAVVFGKKQNAFACVVMANTDILRGSKLVSSKIIDYDTGAVSEPMTPSIRKLMQQFMDYGGILRVRNGVQRSARWPDHRFVQKV